MDSVTEREIERNRVFDAWQRALGDSRCRDPRGQIVMSPIGQVQKLYCLNCGRSGGAVTLDGTTDVLYLCDPCTERHGGLPLPRVPEELIDPRG